MNKRKFLKLEVVWKDADMFELQVNCSNGYFSGVTEVYDTQIPLLEFAKSLKGYPKNRETLTHICGEKDSYSYFEMNFYPIGMNGIVGVEILLESNTTEDRPKEKDKLRLELIVEPNAIDVFQRELELLAINEEGDAELIGVSMY